MSTTSNFPEESITQTVEAPNVVDDPKENSVSYVTPGPTVAGKPAAETKTEGEKPAEQPKEGEKPEGEKPKEKAAGEPDKVPAGVQKRIDQAIAKQRAAEREAAQLKAELARVKQEAAKPPETKPDPNKFEDQTAYLEALAEWKAKETLKAKEAEQAKTDEEVEQEEEKARVETMMETGREKYEDFDAVVLAENLKISPEMIEAAMISEIGAEVLYFLGKNPKEAARLSAIRNPVSVAREIGKIEAKLTSDPEAGKPKPREVSKAPDPINPIKPGAVSDNALESLDMKTYIAKRKEKESGIYIS